MDAVKPGLFSRTDILQLHFLDHTGTLGYQIPVPSYSRERRNRDPEMLQEWRTMGKMLVTSLIRHWSMIGSRRIRKILTYRKGISATYSFLSVVIRFAPTYIDIEGYQGTRYEVRVGSTRKVPESRYLDEAFPCTVEMVFSRTSFHSYASQNIVVGRNVSSPYWGSNYASMKSCKLSKFSYRVWCSEST